MTKKKMRSRIGRALRRHFGAAFTDCMHMAKFVVRYMGGERTALCKSPHVKAVPHCNEPDCNLDPFYYVLGNGVGYAEFSVEDAILEVIREAKL